MAKPFARALYNSVQWRVVRREALRRDRYTCQLCNARASEVHHIVELTPDNIHDVTVALNPTNLQCLCWECHNKMTQGKSDVGDGYYFDEYGHVVKMNGTPPGA